MKKNLLALTLFAVLYIHCDKAEQIPTYLNIQPFSVQAPGGTPAQKITEGWLYVNTEFLGAYTLPASVPVLAQGDAEILVFPGVKENGIAETPNIYPFLLRHAQTSSFSPNGTINVNPVTQYSDDAILPWSAEESSFESSAVPLYPNTNFTIAVDTPLFNRSVLIPLDTSKIVVEVRTENIVLPNTGCCQLWLELNYKNDVNFLLSIFGETGQYVQPVYTFNIKKNWNKIYLNLTNIITQNPKENRYQLVFRAFLPVDSNNKPTQKTGYVWLDNIRLVHF